MDAGFFQRFANVLAEVVQKELTDRNILMLAAEDRDLKAFRHVGRNVTGSVGLYQATLLVEWPGDAERLPEREFLYKYVKKWGIEMGIKLARPGVLTTYEMGLPKGVEAAAVGRARDLLLRCTADYSIQDDLVALRVDALVKWDD